MPETRASRVASGASAQWRWVVDSLRSTRAALAGTDLLLLAAGLTFYAGIAVVPMLLIAVHVAGLAVGHDQVTDLAARASSYAPDELGFADRLADLVGAGADLSPLAVLAALLAGTTYGEGVLRSFERLADVRGRRRSLRGRLRAIGLLAVLPLLVLGGLAFVAVIPGMVGGGAAGSALGAYLSFWAAWLGGAVLLAVTYRAFSPKPIRPGALAWASLGAGSFLAGMSLGWVLVLEVGVEVGRAYGGLEDVGAAVLFAVYLFLVQLVALAGYAWALSLDARRARHRDQPRRGEAA